MFSFQHTVQTFLKKKFPEAANKKLYHEFYFPHRLDYATSGILCIPKNKDVCKIVSNAFSNRAAKKYYIALVGGFISQQLLDINTPIGEDKRHTNIQKMCTIRESTFCINPRSARTVITLLEEGFFDDYPATKVLCRLITGRRHQIRVHCSSVGHTIIGDYTYSNSKDVKPPRMYLHALRLVLPNQVEALDISTKDPFANIKYFKKVSLVQDLELAYSRIDDYVKSLDSP